MGLPALIGAGVGGGLNLIRGKNPLQGALLGGAGGALTGGISNFMNTGSLLGANAVGAEVAKNAIAANAAAGIPGFAGAAGSALPGTIESMGLVRGADGVFRDPTMFTNVFGSPIYTGGQGVLSNAMSDLGASLPSSLKEYATPQNLLGVAQLATPTNQAPLQNIGSGQISRSQVPEYVPFNVGEVQTWKKRGQA